MITLRLQGSLAGRVRERLDDEAKRRSRPGEVELELDARSVAEAMRLIVGQTPGMDWDLRIGSWRVTVDGEPVAERELDMRLPDRAYVSVAPALAGAGPSLPFWGKVLLYVGGALVAGEFLKSQIPNIPDTDHLETGQRRSLFSGPVNSIAQGGAVPLIYGRTRVGSTVVSGGITPDRATGGDHATPEAIGLGGSPAEGGPPQQPAEDRHNPFTDSDYPGSRPGQASAILSSLRVVDLLGEGEIEGLVDGLKSVFIDGVPVEDEDGNRDVEGVEIQERKGLAHGATGQSALEGFDSTSTGLTHAREEVENGTPVIRSIPAGYDAARVTLQWPRLLEYDENGSEIAAEMQFTIEARASGGSWSTVLTQTVRDRSLDVRELAWRVERPSGVNANGTWQIRVTRVTADSTSDQVQDAMWWQRLTGLRDVKQSYPHSAVMGLVIETLRSDVNVTRREYEVKGRKVLAPPASIYDPTSSTSTSAARYGSGVWDGTMRRVWTDNPAWIAYDLLTDRRAGLGGIPGMVEAVRSGRAFFLELSRHCDELVPAPDSETRMEPRWRFNGIIQRREQARRVIDWVLSACRAAVSWNSGAASLSIDGESDVVAAIGNANVVDGEFDYQGLRWQERYSAAAVTWQDPEDEYRSGIELVVSDDLVSKYGYRQKDVAAVGCTSRGQAHRTGLLVLNEQERESETVKFRMALEGMHLRPGDRIQIADQQRFEVRAAFRVKGVDTSTAGRETITLDSESPRLAAGGTMAFGEGETAAVTQAPGEGADVLVTTDVPTGLVPGDLVVNDAAAIDWIVTELAERDQLEALITARRHDPNKYTSIEQRRMLSPPLVDPVAAILPPTSVTVRETTYEDGNLVRSQLEIAVLGGDDPRIDRVEYQIQRPKRRATPEEIAAGDWSALPRGPWEPLRITQARSIVEKNVALGGYRIRARFIGRRRRSAWVLSAELVADGKTDALPAPEGLVAEPAAGGYWVRWTPETAPDYWYTEVFDRVGMPGQANADVDLSEPGWTFRGRISGSSFRRVGVAVTDNLRVAVRHVDTSRLRSPARETGVTPATLRSNDGVGFEWQGTWAAGHGTYRTVDANHAVRDVVAHEGRTWICKLTHEAAAGKAPPAGDAAETSNTWWELLADHGDPGVAGDSFMWRGAWASATEYVLRDCVSSDHRSWICVRAHTSSAANQPTEANGGAVNNVRYWDLMADRGDVGPEANDGVGFEWQGGWRADHGTYRTVDDDHMVRDVVANEGRTWICKLTHAAAANKAPPGTDSTATSNTWWELLADHGNPGVDGDSFMWRGAWAAGNEYEVQECCGNDGRSWICTSDHTAAAGNAPTQANNGGSFWDLLADRGDPGDDAPGAVTSLSGSLESEASGALYLTTMKLSFDYGPGLSRIFVRQERAFEGTPSRIAALPSIRIYRIGENDVFPAAGASIEDLVVSRTPAGVAYYPTQSLVTVTTERVIDGKTYVSGPVDLVLSNPFQGGSVTAPAAPAAPTVSVNSDDVTVQGSAAARATSYALQRRTGTSGSWVTIVASTTNLNQTDLNRPDGSYYYRFVAINSAGRTNGSVSAVATVSTGSSDLPDAPTISGTGGVERYSVTAGVVSGTGTVRYRFEYFTNGAWAVLRTWSTSRTYTVDPATPGSYRIRALAQDTNGNSDPSTAITVTVTAAPTTDGDPPSAPGLTATGGTATGTTGPYTLTAGVVTGDGTIEYLFQVLLGTTWTTVRTWGTSRVHAGTANVETYRSRCYARDADGTSPASVIREFTIAAAGPERPGQPVISSRSTFRHSGANSLVALAISEGAGGDGTSIAVEAYGGSGIGWYTVRDHVLFGNVSVTVTIAANRDASGVWRINYRVQNSQPATHTVRATVSNSVGAGPVSSNRTISAS